MTDQSSAADLSAGRPVTPKGSQITVSERDGDRVTTSTWNACLGVSTLVRTFLGEPAALIHIDIKEP